MAPPTNHRQQSAARSPHFRYSTLNVAILECQLTQFDPVQTQEVRRGHHRQPSATLLEESPRSQFASSASPLKPTMANLAGEWSMSRPSSGVISPRPMRSRTQSLSSDRPSTIGYGLLSPPQSVTPEAAFIAVSAASQIVTNDHDGHADLWYDQNGLEPSDETAIVSSGALQLVNSFLDQLLFSFLQVSKGTTLAALRPAVTEVLKPKLAKDAINNADEELREYLGGADEDDYARPQSRHNSRDWDLELVWKRTRLRCMVYSSLGDMEEEEEDLHMEQENLDIGADESAYISPAVAIFLTSVLEYMGELTLTVAGQASWNRIRAKLEKELRDGTRAPGDICDQVVVEELDMERVALDRTLGRLWRGWKKRIRSPTIDFGHSPNRGSISHIRQESDAADTALPRSAFSTSESRKSLEPAEQAIVEDVSPAEVPLPLGDNDVNEIEVPGLTVHSDDENDVAEEKESGRKRPQSMLITSSVITNGLPTPTKSEPHTPRMPARKRSNSLPSLGAAALHTASNASKRVEGPPSTVEVNDTKDSQLTTSSQPPVEAVPEPSKAQDAGQLRDTTSTQSARRRSRISRIMTGTEAVVPKGPLSAKDLGTPNEPTGDIMPYDRAEIMTSSRISVAGSSSTSLSESGKPLVLKRSSSVHSARIIDVTGPKSPTSSRDTSLDPAERIRPVSISRASSISVPSASDETRKPRTMESGSRAGATGPPSRSPIDRVRPTLQSATTISESDEELDTVPSPIPPRETSRFQGPQPPYGRQAGSSRQEYGYNQSGLRNAPYKAPNVQSPVAEDAPPEIPRKAPGHPSRVAYRTDSTGQISIERTRSRDSEEDISLPLQSNLALKQSPTAGSTGSSSAQRHKAMRTSEDNSSRADDVARTFEELIQSNQTITYTLTPENMRDMDRGFESPVVTKASRKSEENRSHYRSRSSSGTPDSKTAPSYRATPLNMHPVSEEQSAMASSPAVRTPTSPSKSVHRMAGSQARDARTPSESMSDFASFIRSTGPPGDERAPPVRNVPMARTPVDNMNEPRRAPSTSSRSRYQPREAVADSRGDNSDLIDFIRQGPPGASASHRIPRHVAPFRNTMDSDQFNAAIGGRAIDATIPEIRYSQASTNVTENSMPSMHSSVNSSSALLRNKNSPAPTSNAFNDEDMMPKRKTRRVRDPYAIDFSDEEDELDDFAAPVKAPPKKEESLAEFLRNYQPPPEPEAPVIVTKQPKKKASAPSLITRFARGSSSKDTSSPTPNAAFANDSRSLHSRVGNKSGHIPIQVQIPPGYDAYGPVSANSSTRNTPSTASPRRVPMKKFEPREAVSSTSRTSDLASFLRDSGPPTESITSPSRTSFPQEESSGLSKMFGRRKKTPLY
ncbi:hypothetical protein HJFPF1_01922 [Paramyrothecium foliicola]|nr:hypothetical protein HJFPF1_01922 [Paramyrothecium foliicola]